MRWPRRHRVPGLRSSAPMSFHAARSAASPTRSERAAVPPSPRVELGHGAVGRLSPPRDIPPAHRPLPAAPDRTGIASLDDSHVEVKACLGKKAANSANLRVRAYAALPPLIEPLPCGTRLARSSRDAPAAPPAVGADADVPLVTPLPLVRWLVEGPSCPMGQHPHVLSRLDPLLRERVQRAR